MARLRRGAAAGRGRRRRSLSRVVCSAAAHEDHDAAGIRGRMTGLLRRNRVKLQRYTRSALHAQRKCSPANYELTEGPHCRHKRARMAPEWLT